MSQALLICTDLDRTLIPNGPQPEPAMARAGFSRLVEHPQIRLAYVSGRHRELVEKAITHYRLPIPDFVIGDVGTTMYDVYDGDVWRHRISWEEQIGQDWAGKTSADLKSLLADVTSLRLQERSKQNRHKLSFYVPIQADRADLEHMIQYRLREAEINANLIWSFDEPRGIGLLDILPASASKYHAIEALMHDEGFSYRNTVFCGDSGNDLEVISSPIPAVLVANAEPEIKTQASELAKQAENLDRLYIAKGDFHGMNGNYSGGMLEGIAHFHPETIGLMGIDRTEA